MIQAASCDKKTVDPGSPRATYLGHGSHGNISGARVGGGIAASNRQILKG